MSAPHKQAPWLRRTLAEESLDLEAFRDIADDVIESDFVPYACLFDAATLATKNGELVHILKIGGEFATGETRQLREALRRAIAECTPDDSYAFWIHTLRRQRPLLPKASFANATLEAIHEGWINAQELAHGFSNEIYLTIVKAGQPNTAADKKAFLQSLLPPREMAMRTAFMEHARTELHRTTDAMLRILAPYGAARLGLVQRSGNDEIIYGEHLEFLEKLINLEARPMPLVRGDLSEYLTSGDVSFGFNAMEVRTAEGKRRFAAILSVKEYKEASLPGLDQFLDIPCELIVTQCFDFIGAAKARAAYETQARFLQLSGDKELAEWAELQAFTPETMRSEKAFGQQQTSLFMIAPSTKQLETSIKMVRRALSRLGIVVVREDLRLEEMYWAQLPANFPFIARQRSVATHHIGGFVKLETRPIGNEKGSAWGAPITLFRNAQRHAVYFNFHEGASPHVSLIGPAGSGRTSLAHLLVAQAMKHQPQFWYLDSAGRGRPFAESIGARAADFHATSWCINPFQLPDNPITRQFLAGWCAGLIDPKSGQMASMLMPAFAGYIEALMAMPAAQRSLQQFAALVAKDDPMLGAQFAPFARGGDYGAVLDAVQEHFSPQMLQHFDLSAWAETPAIQQALTSYLLFRFSLALNGKPTLLVLDDGFVQLNQPWLRGIHAAWLDGIAARGGVVCITTDALAASAATGICPQIMPAVGQRFYFADARPSPHYQSAFGLSEEGSSILEQIVHETRMTLLERNGDFQLLRFDMKEAPHIIDLLAGKGAVTPKKSGADLLADLMGTRTAESLA
jgi:type IV secretion system protein VirB4